jgi:heme exporter protein D
MDWLTNFLAMGGYARFVWPAYGLTLIVLGGLLFLSLRSYWARRAELAALERQGGGRNRRRGGA